MRRPINQADLATLIDEEIAQQTLLASADVQRTEWHRFGLVTEVGSLETGSFGDWPMPSQFNTFDGAVRDWAIRKPIVLEAFGAEVLKISRGIAGGVLEATGDCTYARSLVLAGPEDPDDHPRILYGFDVYWDFSFPWPGGLQGGPKARVDQSWEDLFG